jgi:Golgi phosphoprotein 3 (GPP34)
MPTLADELVLLAITEKGDVASDAWTRLDNGVAGAHLMELTLQGRTVLEDDKVAVVDDSPTGSGPTDEVLAELAGSDKRRAPQVWIGHLAGRFPHGRVVEDLRRRGILAEQRTKVLKVFNRTRNLEADPEPERIARARLREILLDGRTPDARGAALAALMKATELVEEVFPDEGERGRANERLEELTQGDALGRALGAANEATIHAMMMAVLIATTASVTVATTAAIINT